MPVSDGLVTFKIFVDGSEIPGEYQIMSVNVLKAVNKIASAKITFLDGSAVSPDEFVVSNSDDLKPGKEIEIRVGYNFEEKSIFKGIIVRNNLKITNTSSYLVVECKDKAVKMTVGRKNVIYEDKKDSDIIREIIGNTSGLTSEIEATSYQHEEVVQYYCNDWDFILSRAEVNGMVIIAEDGKIKVGKPATGGQPVEKVTYGIDLFSLNLDTDVRSQVKAVSAVAWDMDVQKVVVASSPDVPDLSMGDKTTAVLSGVIGLDKFLLQSNGNYPQDVLKSWAEAKLIKSKLSKIKGSAKFHGTEKVKPGTIVEFAGLSNQFNGKGYVGGVEHIIEEGNWTTQVQLGLSFDWVSEEIDNIEAPTASGLVPGIKGLTTGIVKKIHEDKKGQYRIWVSIPSFQQDNQGVWARLSSFYASNESGAFFYPEINDEVVVGFINEDPMNPIILGSVHSKKNKSPEEPEETNNVKAIITKSKLKISFDEEKKIISLETPGGNTVVLDDDEKSITLTDSNQNTVSMTQDGVTIDSGKDIILKAGGKITLEATQDIELKATGNLNGEGMAIELKGSTKFAAEGAMTEIKGSGQTTIKGGIVMIN